MKVRHEVIRQLVRIFACGLLAGEMHEAAAQSTAFTYSGRLTGSGAPVSGNYDMRFTLYDAENGSIVAGPLPASPVAVANGLFTVRIDFGAGVFTGAPRWLDVAVRPVGGASYTMLTPRYEVTSSPYSIRSQSAATADGGGGGGGGPWSVSGGNIYFDTGSVGIGTNSPAPGVRLEVNGPTRFNAGGSGGFLQAGTPNGETGLSIVGANRADLRFDGSILKLVAGLGTSPPSPLSGLSIATWGGVGVGAIAPAGRLHVYEPFGSVTELIETGGGINSWSKLTFKNLNGQWDIGTSRGFINDIFFLDRIGTTPIEFQLSKFGDLGLGIEPFAKLHLYNPTTSVSQRIETGGGVNAWTQIEFLNANGRWDVGTSRGYLDDAFYIARVGAASPAFEVKPDGDAFANGKLTVKILTITGGADIAEPFPMEAGIERGSVMVIDPENPGKLKLSETAYDKRVAGVVSGANGVNPGLALKQTGALDEGDNVALSGRVYVLADATTNQIEPGDLLTTSETPGHAMKVSDHAKAQGAILGKAMSPLKQGKGFVLVLVTLQ